MSNPIAFILSSLGLGSPGQRNVKTKLKARLEKAFQVAAQIRELSKVPSISIGVLHKGEVVFCNSTGFRDNENESKTPADEKSLYTLCSVTKTFVSVAFGILVDQGKIGWTDKVSKHLPEFKPEDRRVADVATFIDVFRHTGGLDNPVVSLLGPGGKALVTKEDFLDVLNNTPTKRNGEPHLHSWNYSNVGYGLIVLVIEKISNMPFSQFLQEQVLDHLDMKHTAVTKSQLDTNNIAHSYAQMEDGSFEKLSHEWTDETNSPILGMVGIRSSVEDMLKYSAAIMDAYTRECGDPESAGDDKSSTHKELEVLSGLKNPIKQIGAILNGYYWTRPHGDPFGHQTAYHLGWMKVPMPSCMVSWGSWNETLADCAGPEDRDFRDKNILGQDSGDGLLFKSSGIGFCGSSSVNLFPETHSAVVVFSGGLNNSDASDFVASAFIQELFDLQPRVDIIPMVKHEIAFRKKQFEKIHRDLESNKDVSEPEHDHSDYCGEYTGLGITLLIEKASDGQGMQICFNQRKDTAQPLKHYGKDKYSYWPDSRDEWLKDGWLDWDYYLVGILVFERSEDETKQVAGLTWVWEEGAEPFFFKKKA